MMDKPIAKPPHFSTPKGAMGNSHFITPNVPIFAIIPESNIVPCVGAVTYVSGCHVWKGKIGILIANAIKISQKIILCCDAPKLFPELMRSCMAHDFVPAMDIELLYR